MADTPESKPPFWSSLPGIFTGIGGVIVALTGLIGVLYQTEMIGSKANSNSVPPVTLASVPSASPTPNAENDSYKIYAGKWVVIEKPSLDFGGKKEVIWQYVATVKDNVLTMKGSVSEIDGNKNLPKGAEDVISTIKVQLLDSKGMGEYKTTKTAGRYDLPLTLDDGDPPQFHGSIQKEGKTYCGLMGKKPRF
ncbi:MAG: hypothetical protein WBD27_19180 [Pyrinomonadaceae bacterium]